jgi:hypothetical protein
MVVMSHVIKFEVNGADLRESPSLCLVLGYSYSNRSSNVFLMVVRSFFISFEWKGVDLRDFNKPRNLIRYDITTIKRAKLSLLEHE